MTTTASSSRARYLARVTFRVLVVGIGLLWLVPIFGLFVSSLRNGPDNATSGWWRALSTPSQLTLGTYAKLLSDGTVVQSLVNTTWIAVPATVLVIAISAPAAYALAWIRFRGRELLMTIVVALLVVPVQLAFIPVAELYRSLHIFGSIPSVVLFHVAFGLPFAIFLLRNFFRGIPADLIESAWIDGASNVLTFRKVILPLSVPAVTALGIFQFLSVWNDLLVALVFAGPDARPITLALQSQLRTFGTNIDVLAAGSFVSMIVPLVVFVALRRHFVAGVLRGSDQAR